MTDISIDFSAETRADAEKRLTAGYRARRNFLVADLLGMIVYTTPVKDGYARGGWYVSVGGVGSTTPRGPDKDGARTVLEGLASLRGQSVFKDIIIDNDVDYIDLLEEGYSGQAPQGMVRVSLAAFKAKHGDAI